MTKPNADDHYQGQLDGTDLAVYRAHRRGGVTAALAYRHALVERAARQTLPTPGGHVLDAPYAGAETVYQVNARALTDHTISRGSIVDLPDGARANVFVYADPDASPEHYDCYDEGDIDAWRADRWRFVGVAATVKLRDGRTGEASLWGIEVGAYWPGTERAQVWESAVDMIDEAIHEAEKAPTTDAAALDRLAALLDGAEWSSDLCEPVIDIITSTGRTVRDPNEV